MSSPVYTLALDIAKARLDACLLPPQERFPVANTAAGHDALKTRLQALGGTAAVRVVVEATGGYERAVHETLTAAGYAVTVANPKRIRDFARALGLRAKTDRLDAAVIAQYGATLQPAATPVKTPAAAALAELLAYRGQIVQEITQRPQQLSARSSSPSTAPRPCGPPPKTISPNSGASATASLPRSPRPCTVNPPSRRWRRCCSPAKAWDRSWPRPSSPSSPNLAPARPGRSPA